MKKLAIMVAILCALLCGCSVSAGGAPENNRLFVVGDANYAFIYVDKRTGVQYLVSYKGGVAVMVDADGNPLIWEGE